MTSVRPPGYAGDDHAQGLAGGPRRGPEPWRVAAAALIVAVVVAAIWLWGRPKPESVPVLAAATAEAWLAGQPPGAFEIVEVPQHLSAQFADPDSIAGSVAAFDLPAGTLVTPALLGARSQAAGAQTVMRFSADTSAWPEPGPGAGGRAVVAGVLGGCALDVTTLAGGADGVIEVRVDAPAAARYARAAELDGLVVWPAPPDGWPECRPARPAGTVSPLYGSLGPPSLGSDAPPGYRSGPERGAGAATPTLPGDGARG